MTPPVRLSVGWSAVRFFVGQSGVPDIISIHSFLEIFYLDMALTMVRGSGQLPALAPAVAPLPQIETASPQM